MQRPPLSQLSTPTEDQDAELAWREKQRGMAEARARLLAAKNGVPAVTDVPGGAALEGAPDIPLASPPLEHRRDQRPRENPLRDRIDAIGAELGETELHARQGIGRLLKRCGDAFVDEHLAKARAVEAGGGMLTTKNDRRRTFGGVFFALARQTLGDELWREMFPWPSPRRAKKTAAPLPPPSPPVKTLPPGEARTVKVTIVGRPGLVVVGDGCIETTMENRKAPDLPKGLPPLPTTSTRWRVFIAKKPWLRIEPALSADPADLLLVEGWGAFDSIGGTMTVYAMNATTVALQRAAKASKPASE